ncbi:MAG: HlyD family efflux transporter periplasmic adaptor subunit [Hyphomicrobiaceae bacterium]
MAGAEDISGASARPRTPVAGMGEGAGEQAAQIGAAALLAMESKVRAARNETELAHLIVNELRKLVGGRQAILFRQRAGGVFKVVCVSSLVLADKDTPFLRWLEGMAAEIVRERGNRESIAFELPAFVDKDAAETRGYPFTHVIWQPLELVSGGTFAALLIARERPWTEQDRRVIIREAGVLGSFWQAMSGQAALLPKRRFPPWVRLAAGATLIALSLVPVPMTTLAPVEIVARSPQRVTAPIDGIIEDILVDPNRPVVAGQPLLRFDQTSLRNKAKIAEQERLLAQARVDRASHAAFVDETARHDMALAQAELDLRQAESDYAADLLARSVIVADRDGVLIYADKDRWIGRPVRTGERIMEIVDPTEIAAKIEVPVADAIVLAKGAHVRLFLDANPLTVIPAHLVSEGYHAEPSSTQQLVYRLLALVDAESAELRIGARGTAQLQGDTVPLIFYLLRRPISWLRQRVGL